VPVGWKSSHAQAELKTISTFACKPLNDIDYSM